MTYLVILILTFNDGSVFRYNDGKWPVVSSMSECESMIKGWVHDMRIKYANSKLQPSTFITGCAAQEKH